MSRLREQHIGFIEYLPNTVREITFELEYAFDPTGIDFIRLRDALRRFPRLDRVVVRHTATVDYSGEENIEEYRLVQRPVSEDVKKAFRLGLDLGDRLHLGEAESESMRKHCTRSQSHGSKSILVNPTSPMTMSRIRYGLAVL